MHAVHADPYTAKHKVGSGIEPIQTCPHFVTRTSCCGEATGTPWPLPHEMLSSERIPQTFFIACRIALSASRHSYKMWISRARATNEQVIRRTSPARGQSTLENGVQRRVWWQHTSL